MPVLVEAISVIIRADRLCEIYPGGWDAFRIEVPNATLCADNELVRVGFMIPEDVGYYIDRLSEYGFVYLEDGKAKDLVVADQLHGLAAPCEWAEFTTGALDDDPNKKVSACNLKDGEQLVLATPEGWKFEGSLSDSYTFTPTEAVEKSLTFLREENGLEVHRSELTGKDVYAGRVKNPE